VDALPVTSTITCPSCGTETKEQMDVNACRCLYTCPGCGEQLRPLSGDCCVFCSYGDRPCPPKQTGNACCA
jgi:hypothetical protein